MLRIAGTGRYRENINEKIERRTAFEKCLISGKPQIIVEEEKSNPACLDCPKKIHVLKKPKYACPFYIRTNLSG
jgi:hypothetical protein